MYLLYHFPYSQHARRVHALLEEAGLDYELRHVAMNEAEHRSSAYLRINPNGQVPTLIDRDVTIHESNAIMRYLCFKHDLIDWYPADLKMRAEVEQWLDWNTSRLSQTVIDIVFNSVFRGEDGDKAAIARGREKLTLLLPILHATLRENEYLSGARPTIADLSIASNMTQLALADAAPTAGPIARWIDRVNEIPGVRKSLPG